jgi:hypothetical protein
MGYMLLIIMVAAIVGVSYVAYHNGYVSRTRRYDMLRVRREVEKVAPSWLINCNHMYGDTGDLQVQVRALSLSEVGKHDEFSAMKDVYFYEKTYIETSQKPKTVPGYIHWAAITNNTCRFGVYETMDKLKTLLEADSQVEAVEWMRGAVWSRLIVHRNGEFSHARLPLHDFIRIKLRSGDCLVADFSGWQFGFQDCFHTWEDYKNNYLDSQAELRTKAPQNEAKRFLRAANPESQETFRRMMGELEEMTDAELKAYGRKVDLQSQCFVPI